MIVIIEAQEEIEHIKKELEIAGEFLRAATYAETLEHRTAAEKTESIANNLRWYREKMAQIKRNL